MYIAVVDQNSPSLAFFRFQLSTSSTPAAADKAERKDEKHGRRRRGSKMGKLLGRIFVCFTILLISFNGYSSQIFIIWPWYGREVSVDLLKLIIPFKYVCSVSPARIKSWSEPACSFLLMMLWWNYYLCIVTDPGRVPPQWVHTSIIQKKFRLE